MSEHIGKIPNGNYQPGRPRRMADGRKILLWQANRYYASREGSWLHKAGKIDFKGPQEAIKWITAHKPKAESSPLRQLVTSLSYGNKSVRKQLETLEIAANAHEYFWGAKGDWLRQGQSIRFNDPMELIGWLYCNRPDAETDSLSFLTTALGCGNRTVRTRLEAFKRTAGEYEYYVSNKGAWLQQADNIAFKSPIELVRWLVANKPENETNSLSYLTQCLGTRNAVVGKHLKSCVMYAGACDYYFSKEGKWLRRAESHEFKTPIGLINWIQKHRPKGETNSIAYLIQCLGTVNKSVQANMRNWVTNAGAYEYYHGQAGKWLKRAGSIEFKTFIEVVSWLLANKPQNETNGLGYLVQCLGFGNPSVEKHSYYWTVQAGAYDYIQRKKGIKKELNSVYGMLGWKRLEKTPQNMKKHIDKSKFTQLRYETKLISDDYLTYIMNMYLFFIKKFRRTW